MVTDDRLNDFIQSSTEWMRTQDMRYSTMIEKVGSAESGVKYHGHQILQHSNRLELMEDKIQQLQIDSVRTSNLEKDIKRLFITMERVIDDFRTVADNAKRNSMVSDSLTKVFWMSIGLILTKLVSMAM